MPKPLKDMGEESYSDGEALAQDVYDAIQDDDEGAFAAALRAYVQHCIEEQGGGGLADEVG